MSAEIMASITAESVFNAADESGDFLFDLVMEFTYRIHAGKMNDDLADLMRETLPKTREQIAEGLERAARTVRGIK